MSSTQDNTPQDHPFKPGTVISIKLVNFMCHETFEVSLGSRVNFIIGPNGSGKSALLTALVVAFGGRATTTSRAKKNSEFVKYGKAQAKVSVVIHNYSRVMEKDQAFKPDDYGKFITVERTLFKDDSPARLVLKNDKGKKVSERKHELDELMDHFGIQINNPICILNQEVSKTFLHSKRPEDKFELFMKATNLEQIEQDYDSAQQSYKEWEDCNSRKTVAFKLLDAEYNSCKEKTTFLENRAKLNDTRQKLTRELIWAIIKDNEDLTEKLRSKVETINASLAEALAGIESRKAKIKTHNEDIELMKAKIQSTQNKIFESRQKFEKIRSKTEIIRTKKAEVDLKVKQSKRRISSYQDDATSLQSSIKDMKRKFRDQNSLDQDNEQRKKEIENIEKELPNLRAREKSLRLHSDQLNSSMLSTRSDLQSANMQVNTTKSKLAQNHALLRRLKGGQENALRKYGDHIIRALDEIDRAHKQGHFKHKPIGPIGHHLKLKNQDVGPALECHLGRNAHAFICDNHQDMTRLSNIFKKISSGPQDFRQPTIITRPFSRRHDVSRHRAHHDTNNLCQ